MLENQLLDITNKLRLRFYQRIFKVIREREGSLTAMEVFSVEIIHALNKPTISEFADFIGISRPGASYKIASLIQKGYIKKEASEDDRREYRLCLTDKYYNYIKLYENNFRKFVLDTEKQYSEETLLGFKKALDEMNERI